MILLLYLLTFLTSVNEHSFLFPLPASCLIDSCWRRSTRCRPSRCSSALGSPACRPGRRSAPSARRTGWSASCRSSTTTRVSARSASVPPFMGAAPSRRALPPTGLIQVWILLLEQLTAAVSTCPRQHQPPTLELLFTLLREVTVVPGDAPAHIVAPPHPRPLTRLLPPPGPGFAVFSVIQLLLPVMALWLQRSHGEHSYWDVAAANFKHAIGLCCELVVEHVNSFIHSGETPPRKKTDAKDVWSKSSEENMTLLIKA